MRFTCKKTNRLAHAYTRTRAFFNLPTLSCRVEILDAQPESISSSAQNPQQKYCGSQTRAIHKFTLRHDLLRLTIVRRIIR